ncbi:amidase [Saprospiraceae bacterium]|nr:amidase [Saprospiraceae bacterium]
MIPNRKTFLLFSSAILLAFFSGLLLNFQMLENEITRDIVQNASKIMGIEFQDAEIDSMLPELNEMVKTYETMREDSIGNEVAPALVFSPLPRGFEVEKTQRPISYEDVGIVDLPETQDDLAFYSVSQLAELIRNQKITSVELTQFFLDRLKKYNDTLHCVITFTEDLALEQARLADAELAQGKYRGMLHGIPYGAKDLFAKKGYKTTWGAMPYKDQMIDEDATVISKLENEGAVLIAKFTLGALAWGDVWFDGKTRNPWDTSRGSSGSSAGSASAVAAGLVPFALGTETLGSIVSPSTVCGATGLRPTFGRVSRHGAMALSWSMDKVGPITRSAEDCAIVLDAIRGSDGQDQSVIDAPFNYRADANTKKIKIGYLKSAFEGDYGFKKNDSLALQKLQDLGYELIPIELPKFPSLTFVLQAEAAAAFDNLTRNGQDDLMVRQIKNAWPNVFRAARFMPAVEYLQANRLRTQLIEEMQKIMTTVDVYIHPSWASRSLGITNLTGHPCLVLPNGFRDGRPTSISITGQLFGEAEVLNVGKVLEKELKFYKNRPEGF